MYPLTPNKKSFACGSEDILIYVWENVPKPPQMGRNVAWFCGILAHIHALAPIWAAKASILAAIPSIWVLNHRFGPKKGPKSSILA